MLQVTLSLTPELVQQLFAEKPHLHRAHTVLVPEKVSEKEFWERYFNYEVARKVCRWLLSVLAFTRKEKFCWQDVMLPFHRSE